MVNFRNSAPEIEAARPQIAVIGIGAIEQHGRHLPVATDWNQVREISRRVAVELDALLLPALPYSMSECHGLMPGTFWLKPATLSAVLQDVARSAREQGIPVLLVLNGHGGNFVLEPTIQALNQRYPDLQVLMPGEVWAAAGGEPIYETAGQGIHAEEVETSMQLYLNPEDVKEERFDYVPPVGREYLDYVVMPLINPEGTWGYPSYGAAEKAERGIQAQVVAVVDFVQKALAELG
ncbi:MAG: creatininase family protein [Candidatus Promineifilaceae bacterium]